MLLPRRPTTRAHAVLPRQSLAISSVVHVSLLGALAALPLQTVALQVAAKGTDPVVEVALLEEHAPERFPELEEALTETETTEVVAEALDVEEDFEEPTFEEVEPAAEQDEPEDVRDTLQLPGYELEELDRSLARPARESRPEPPTEPEHQEVASDAAAPEPAAADTEPVLLEAPPPTYPTLARRRGWQGVVLCRLAIDDTGSVRAAGIAESSGYAILDDAAVEAVRAWRFRPGKRGGAAAPVELLHRVVFRLGS